MTEILELSDRNLKVAIIKIVQQAITDMFETNESWKSQQRNRM